MADFVQSNEPKSAVLELAAPILDVATFKGIEFFWKNEIREVIRLRECRSWPGEQTTRGLRNDLFRSADEVVVQRPKGFCM